ncbi:MAG: transposase [Actinomycetota bacterium]|nr:transposase [Actinomycetota bacterium]
MSQRKAVTKTIATRYKRVDKAGKGVILDELCATTGWHRGHARKAQAAALKPKVVRTRERREPRYGADVVVALAFCWAVLGAPSVKRLAPVNAELVLRLRRFRELMITDEVAVALIAMSAATMGRRLAGDRAKMRLRGRSRDACRQAAWRRRHQPAPSTPVLPASRPRKPHTVYECPECEARLLGTQTCADCHTFMRRLGPGGSCSSCDEPITFHELLDT